MVQEPELDAAQAGGDDPARIAGLALRAEQLADPKKREQLAEAILRVIATADRHKKGAVINALAPFRPSPIDTNRSLLRDLAARLGDRGPRAPPGVAMTSLMLENGAGPLYFDNRPATLEPQFVPACRPSMPPSTPLRGGG